MTVIVALVLAIAVPVVAVSPPNGEHYNVNFVTELSYTDPLFYDGFGGDLSAWDYISGTWAIVDESGDNVCSIDGGSYVGGVVATAGGESWTDYAMEFDVKKVNGSYFNVVFRYTDESNHYLLEPSSDAVHIALFKKIGGGYIELTSPRPLQNTTVGTWYHYRIVVQGPSIKVYVDNMLKIDVVDNSLTQGKIGIGSLYGSVVYFDDVQVKGVNPDEVLIGVNTSVSGLQYIAGDTFEILDHDAGVLDGDCAVLQLPLTAVYDIYCSARGRPGGSIIWGSNHEREDVPAGKPTWHQHSPDNFSLGNYGSPLGPFGIITADDATILATRWYPQ